MKKSVIRVHPRRGAYALSLIGLVLGLAGCRTITVVTEIPPLSEVSRDRIESHILEGRPSRALQDLDLLKRYGSTIPHDQLEELREDAEGSLLTMFAAAVGDGDFGNALSIFRSANAVAPGPALVEGYGEWTESSLLAAMADDLLDEGENVAAYMVFYDAFATGQIPPDTMQRFYESALSNGYVPVVDLIEESGVTPAEHPYAPADPTMLLKGSVTILVNKGIRLERGVGYPDGALGSGFFVDPRGYVLTNYHVIKSEVDPEYEGFSRLYISLHDAENEKIPAQVVGWDSVLDIALLKAEVVPEYVFPFDGSVSYNPGDTIYAIGSPGGLRNTVTSGIVSATGRKFLQIGNTLQVDVPVNPGNSGGPLIDAQGSLIGVVFAGIEQFEGVNFAIPGSWVVEIMPRLFAGGPTTHSWLGLTAEDTRKGLEVSYSVPGGAAYRSGIRQGDIIARVNGIAVSSPEEVQRQLVRISPDTLVDVEWQRDDETFSGLLSVDKRPERPLDVAIERDTTANLVAPLFGMVLEETGSYFWDRTFAIRHVYPGGVADETGLSVNDPLTIQDWTIDEENRIAYLQIVVKKKKAGFIERVIQLAAYLEVPNFM